MKALTQVKTFTQEVRTELGKVSWTTRQQLIESTKVVLGSVFLLALYIAICDFILSHTMRFLMR